MSDRSARLPESGPGRRIFLNALHEYRNSCQPPELTPGCPFFTWTSNGPACGEQCADLLAQYDDDPGRSTIDVGAGIALVRNQPRRRARRSPDSSNRPFDARQIYLEDEHRPHPDRRTVALIYELASLIVTPPEFAQDVNERSYDISAAREQLETRGFDTATLIRYGFSVQLPMYFAAPILFAIAREDERFQAIAEGVDSLSGVPQPSEEWRAFFRHSFEVDAESSGRKLDQAFYALHGFTGRLRDWLQVASIDDIIAWKAPTGCPVNVSVPALEADSASSMRETAIWMTDRFTIADLGEWSSSSLRLEWRYLHGWFTAPCSPAAMAERKIDSSAVSRTIADEVSVTKPEIITTAQKLVPVAIEHCRNGKPEIAAAIFDAIVSINPEDADAHNNLGFCMLPIDPVAALPELELADKLSGGTLVTLANRVLALHLAGRNADALALARSDRVSDLPASTATTMWIVQDPAQLVIRDVTDLRSYMASLVARIETDTA